MKQPLNPNSTGVGKIKLDLSDVDLISFAPHKFYGLNGSAYDKVDMNIYNSTKNVNLNTLISYIEDGEVHHFMDKY